MHASHVDGSILSFILCTFCIYRVLRSRKSSFLRKTGMAFMVVSVCALCAFSFLLVMVGSTGGEDILADIKRVGYLDGVYVYRLANHSVDVVRLINVCYTLQHTFRTSALFILIGLWLPCVSAYAYRRRSRLKDHLSLLLLDGSRKSQLRHFRKTVTHESITTFSVLYGLMRIPLSLFIDFYRPDRERATVFFRAIFYGFECYLIAFFILILQIRFFSTAAVDDEDARSTESLNMLVLALVANTFLAHTMTILSLPFAISTLTEYVLDRIEEYTLATVYLVMVTLLCPLTAQVLERDSNKDVPAADSKDECDNACGSMYTAYDKEMDKDVGLIEFKGKKDGHQ